MSAKKKTLVILDSHALIHRSFHALPSFTSPSGEPMGAVYGVSAVLLKLIRELAPTHIVAAFDRAEPTFRHVAYEKYKATRTETKSDLIPQFDKVKEVFGAFGIPVFEVAGFEADDIIGTLTNRFKKEKDLSIIIASGDMDTLQLVDGDVVQVYTLRKGIEDTVLYDQKKVEDRFGFTPKLITDFKGLKGDPSDNIIGVKGIGEKTATELIKNYGTIEEIYEALKKMKKPPAWLKERIVRLLLENEEEALFSKELASIRYDVPVNPELGDIEFRGISVPAVTALFKKFHFPSLIARLPQEKESIEKKTEIASFELTSDSFTRFKKIFESGKERAIFYEKESVALVSDEIMYVCPRENIKDIRSELLSLLADSKNIITHDAKELFHILESSFPVVFDVRLAAWVCDSERRALTLPDLASSELPTNVAQRPQALFALEKKYRARLAREELEQIYFDFELPLVPVLYEIERAGIAIDEKKLKDLGKETSKEMDVLQKEILAAAGEPFDVNSPKQLSHILFDVLKLPTKGIKKTSTKAVSTQASELEKLRGLHPIIELLLTYRELAKLSSTYITVLPELRNPQDGRIHTTFNQAGAATGRLSSNNPNLQNIPTRTERGRNVRGAFVAEKGFELVSFDYSQLELRLAAALSGDESLIAAFHEGDDIHRRTAALVFRVDEDRVTPQMRRYAKTINFGILYGMGARALATSMGVSAGEAEQYLEAYIATFPGIERFRKNVIEEGSRAGYVKTLFGRKRYLPNLRSSFDFVRKEAERMAMNAPIQGTNADIIKRAMIDIHRTLKLGPENKKIRMVLQVHDELLFEIEKKYMNEAIPEIKRSMEYVPEVALPIVVDVKHGPNWQDMKPYKQ